MKDYFALMGIPRRPAVDDAAVKEAYFRLAAAWHPDAERGETEKFRQLQEAFQTLKEPVSRLRHLAELEFGPAENSSRPAEQMDLFLAVGAVVQEAKAFQSRREGARSALAKAVMGEAGREIRQRVQGVQTQVETALEGLRVELKALDQRWPEVSPAELQTLTSGWRYLSRWQSELAAAEFALMVGA